jgi:hypothetical protein
MVKLESRLARFSAGVAGVAVITSGLALSATSDAHAQTRANAPQITPVSCAHEANGYTGGPHVSGTKWTKQQDNCGNFWLIVAYNTSTSYRGYYLQNGIWHGGANGWHYCAAGSVCNDALVTQVLAGTRLTVNSSNGGNAHIEVGY